MELYNLTEEERRILCKQALESLEFWLRRIIHESLSQEFGDNYLEAKNSKGDNIIKNEIRNKIKERKDLEPDRFPRLIDASLLEQEIDIICNPELFTKYFFAPLKKAFPDGREEARTFLKRLEYPRNCLYHANPISVRLSEQVICYSHDIIESFKEYYIMTNKEKEFNVPTVIKATDSFGNVFHFSDGVNSYHLTNNPKFYLRPGDILTVELGIDPSFSENDYTLSWEGVGFPCDNKKVFIKIEEEHIREVFMFGCNVTSNKSWHKFVGGFDHNFFCTYKVLPPL